MRRSRSSGRRSDSARAGVRSQPAKRSAAHRAGGPPGDDALGHARTCGRLRRSGRRPPRCTPLMKAASSLARYRAALATSSAVEKRPSGIVDRGFACRASSSGPRRTRPTGRCRLNTGLMQLTRMLSGPSSAASDFDSVMAAPLDALYPGQPRARTDAGRGSDGDEAAATLAAEHRHGVHGGQVQALHVDLRSSGRTPPR